MNKSFRVLIVSLCYLMLLGCDNETDKKPYNILWLVAEDLSPDYLSAYGDKTAPTPHLDRLAKEGVVYDLAFSVAGVCSPSRATLATGLYASSFGAHNMRTMWQEPNARKSGIIDYEAVPPAEVKMVSDIIARKRLLLHQ